VNIAHVLESHRANMTRTAYAIVRDRDAAEDVVQEAMLRALSHGIASDGNIGGWLYRVTRNLALDHNRAGDQRLRCDVSDYRDMPDGELSQSDAMEDEERSLRIRAALHLIPASLGTIVTLRYFHGMSHRQISARLGITEQAAKIRMHRAKRALRAILQNGRAAA
jgi:RNA polymerase sigma-70 factor, ECF subfamily